MSTDKPRTIKLGNDTFEAITATGGASGLCTQCHFASNPGCAEANKKDDCRKPGTQAIIWINTKAARK